MRADGPDPPKPRQPNVLVTEQLVSDVIEAGGSLTLPRRRSCDPGYVDYEYRVRLAERHGKVPAGKRLRVERVSYDEIRIDLVDDQPALLSKPGSCRRLARRMPWRPKGRVDALFRDCYLPSSQRDVGQNAVEAVVALPRRMSRPVATLAFGAFVPCALMGVCQVCR